MNETELNFERTASAKYVTDKAFYDAQIARVNDVVHRETLDRLKDYAALCEEVGQLKFRVIASEQRNRELESALAELGEQVHRLAARVHVLEEWAARTNEQSVFVLASQHNVAERQVGADS